MSPVVSGYGSYEKDIDDPRRPLINRHRCYQAHNALKYSYAHASITSRLLRSIINYLYKLIEINKHERHRVLLAHGHMAPRDRKCTESLAGVPGTLDSSRAFKLRMKEELSKNQIAVTIGIPFYVGLY